ncbi:metal dependent phosphohydrolase [Dethiosulfovibrio peptidovorans DSM 11002]|uniref:Metal dependent phosphohydrolase n=1 Tax=Dethiosulfovibrio peptidovorans DSM 11002 TaxID=469381 RepID=D2Z6Y7_9BACT|nr:HD domain-containing phosphohydrolase [Dethiosulfovibrio peptidovorans]EFC91234.1 metal dependent phosphohydrolase [Dethiosulfovibrio peptidovorans DSM 11002]
MRSLRSYGRLLGAIMVGLSLLGGVAAFCFQLRSFQEIYEDSITSRFNYLSQFLEDKLSSYRNTMRYWGVSGMTKGVEDFMMSSPELRGLLFCDRNGTVRWSNLPYVQGGMSVSPKFLSGEWIPSVLFGDMSSPGLILSVPLPDGWLLCDVNTSMLLESVRLRSRGRSVMALVGADGRVIHNWGRAEFASIGMVLPRVLLRDRYQEVVLSMGKVNAFSRRLVGGLFLVAFYPQKVLIESALSQAVVVAALIFLGGSAMFLVFWIGHDRISRSFGRWVDFLAGASDRIGSCQSSFTLAEYLVDFEGQMGALDHHFEEEARLGDAFQRLIRTIGDKEESIMALLEETTAMEESLKQTNDELELVMAQLENIMSLAEGASDGNTLQGVAESIASNLRRTFRCGYVAFVAFNRSFPYIWGESGERCSPLLSSELSYLGEDPLFEDGRLSMPVSFMGRVQGYVVIEGISSYGNEKVVEVLRRFGLTLGGLLHANELLIEVRSSFHYFALRMQAFTEIYHEETGEHVARVGEFAAFFARQLGFSEGFVEDIRIYAQLHDIGKLRVPKEILGKPGSLSDAEFEEIKKHTIYGAEVIGDSSWLDMARNICLCHHERWDGTGYPRGLVGTDIPIEGRIVALCDVYDALRGERCYKPPFSHEKARRIILEGDGRVMPGHFDPEILDIFRENDGFFERIYGAFSNEEFGGSMRSS